MKFKTIAAAALAAVASVASMSAHADVAVYDNAEIVFVVYDEARSYAIDTGYTMNDFIANANTPGWTWTINMGTMFNDYKALDTNLFDGSSADGGSGTRWSIAATDTDGFADPGALRQLMTLPDASDWSNVTNETWTTVMNTLGYRLREIGATGTHATPYTVENNGESVNLQGTNAYWGDMANYLIYNITTGTAVGQSSRVTETERSNDYDETVAITTNVFAGRALFDGTTFTYSVAAAPVVPAVPEPGSLALVAAGLGAMGFVGRRRRSN